MNEIGVLLWQRDGSSGKPPQAAIKQSEPGRFSFNSTIDIIHLSVSPVQDRLGS